MAYSNALQILIGELDDVDWHEQLELAKAILEAAIAQTNTTNSTGGAVTLTSADGANDAGKALRQRTTGVLASDLTVTLPAKPRIWVLTNANTGAFLTKFKVGSSELSVAQGKSVLAYSDGSTISLVSDNTIEDLSITTAKLAALAVTSAKLADGSVTTAKLAPNAVELANISAAAIASLLALVPAVPLAAVYVSPVSGYSTVTYSHSLGGVPDLVIGEAICISADQGYSVGDIVAARSSLWWNATQVGFTINAGTNYEIQNKSTGSTATLDKTKWNLKVRCWR